MNEKDNYTARDQSAELLENAQLEIKEKEELKEKIETFKRLGNKARELAEYGEKGLTERVDRYFGALVGSLAYNVPYSFVTLILLVIIVPLLVKSVSKYLL